MWRYWRAGQVQSVLLLGNHGRQGDEVGDDGYYVYNIHHVSKEIELVRTRQKPHYQFECKPDDTQRFDQEERVGDVGDFVFLDLSAVGGGVEDFVVFELRKGLQAEDDDGQQDHEHGDDSHDAGSLGALGVFEEQPDLALALVGGEGFLLLLDEALILTVKGLNRLLLGSAFYEAEVVQGAVLTGICWWPVLRVRRT